MIRINYEKRGHKGDVEEDGEIELYYTDHAILCALFSLFIERGIRFTVKVEPR